MHCNTILGYFTLLLLGNYHAQCQLDDGNLNQDELIQNARNGPYLSLVNSEEVLLENEIHEQLKNEINEQFENENTEQFKNKNNEQFGNIDEESHDDEIGLQHSGDDIKSNEDVDQLFEEKIDYKVSEDQNIIELIQKNGKGDEIGVPDYEEHNSKMAIEENEPSNDQHFMNRFQEEVEKLQEHKHVPLREILLKLKPPGLLDEDDEQQAEVLISTLTGRIDGDVEGDEPLSSSGLTGTVQDVTLGLTNISKANSNVSLANVTTDSVATTATTKQAVCEKLEFTDPITNVEILNATQLQKHLKNDPNIVGRSTVAICHLIYFFSPYCEFSISGSAYVNGLARSIPNIPVYGLDSIEYHSMNARYGVMGTPTLILFHNGNVVGRYNASEYSTAQLSAFISHYTTEEVDFINITSADFEANLPSKLAVASPYTLWVSWSFIFMCTAWLFLTSELCAKLTEAVLNNWREAEAQHAHED